MMLKQIIKRDGSIETFDPAKVNHWATWAAFDLEDRIDWSSIVMDAVADCTETTHSQVLQRRLIQKCIERQSWAYHVMAGRLEIALVRKEIYDNQIPTVKSLHTKLAGMGLMRTMGYSDAEYDEIEKMIDHQRDFNFAQFQLDQYMNKYAIQDRVNNKCYETPQFIYMRMAMALSEEEPRQDRLMHVKNFYEHFSQNRINPPTPNLINLGTPHNGYASCCLYKSGDSAPSLLAGDAIAYTMTYMSAGIGNYIETRSLKDPVRNGMIAHKGKMPYYRALAAAVHANTQGGRGGAATSYFSCFDPEASEIIMLQNPRTPVAKQNRDIHFAMMYNRFFAVKVKNNENIFTFNVYTAPDLMKAFFMPDDELFTTLYHRYEADPNFKKNYVNARDLVVLYQQQSHEVSTLYALNIQEVNHHTSFLETIHSSNLCTEITSITKEYDNVFQLSVNDYVKNTMIITDQGSLKVSSSRLFHISRYESLPAAELKPGMYITAGRVKQVVSEQEPEVGLCSLGSIVVPNIKNDEQYESAAYYTLKMIDYCIHHADYELPHVGFTAKKRLNAGVGLVGVARVMAKKGLPYNCEAGYRELDRIAERHAYFTIRASLRLGKELGNAPWIGKTKWPQGWLPIDTYKKSIDRIVPPTFKYDWEELRQEIIKNGGIRNSSLISQYPTESSSKAAGEPNGIYPVRQLSLKKKDADNVINWIAKDNDILGDQYQLAWEIPTEDMCKIYGIFQKWTDQSISADFYEDRIKNPELDTEKLVRDFLYMVMYGVKSKYYQNSLTVAADTNETVITQKVAACASGGCGE